MSSSDLSSLSSAESIETDEELFSRISRGKIDAYFSNGASGVQSTATAPKKKRPVSPPHEYVLADNPDIALIVMFRSRFSSAFPGKLPHFGPQDIENGVIDSSPDENIERLLCALLGLVLNRKKDVERGHYGRALEEAIHSNNHQWPPEWEGKNPLHAGGSFNNMSAQERLNLLKTLLLWSLHTSDAISAIIKDSYKQQRHDDDLNQPLSVQPWGRDGERRRYWLIEGQDDTHFRLYRESRAELKHNTWFSVASSIDDLKIVALKLEEEGSQAGRRLRDRIMLAIPRFEAGEEKRKRREYRQTRKAQFTRPEPGFSLYEGRTRGKRIRYTYSDEEEGMSDALSSRRSNRQSGISTPAEHLGPTFTASGRQVRSRVGGTYGESMLSSYNDGRDASVSHGDDDVDGLRAGTGLPDDDEEPVPRTRPRRPVIGSQQDGKQSGKRAHIQGYNELDEMEDESDASSSGHDWDGDDDEDDVNDNLADDDEDEEEEPDEDDMSNSVRSLEQEVADLGPRSLVVSLRYHKKATTPAMEEASTTELQMNGNGPHNPVAAIKGPNGEHPQLRDLEEPLNGLNEKNGISIPFDPHDKTTETRPVFVPTSPAVDLMESSVTNVTTNPTTNGTLKQG